MKHIIILLLLALSVPMLNACDQNKAKSKKDLIHNVVDGRKSSKGAEVLRGKDGNKKSPNNSVSVTVIDFYADWCGPCRQIRPDFERLEHEYAGELNFTSVNIDDNPDVADQYNIMCIPTFVFVDASGRELDRIEGASVEMLTEKVKKYAKQ